MTTPTIWADGFDGTFTDFLKAPGLSDGSISMVQNQVTVATATGTAVLIGLIPFRKGARFKISNSSIWIPEIDDGDNDVTMDVGYVYDDNATYTDDPNAWVTVSTIGQTGGFVVMDEVEGVQFVAEADGWLTMTTGGGTTNNEVDIEFAILVDYKG